MQKYYSTRQKLTEVHTENSVLWTQRIHAGALTEHISVALQTDYQHTSKINFFLTELKHQTSKQLLKLYTVQ